MSKEFGFQRSLVDFFFLAGGNDRMEAIWCRSAPSLERTAKSFAELNALDSLFTEWEQKKGTYEGFTDEVRMRCTGVLDVKRGITEDHSQLGIMICAHGLEGQSINWRENSHGEQRGIGPDCGEWFWEWCENWERESGFRQFLWTRKWFGPSLAACPPITRNPAKASTTHHPFFSILGFVQLARPYLHRSGGQFKILRLSTNYAKLCRPPPARRNVKYVLNPQIPPSLSLHPLCALIVLSLAFMLRFYPLSYAPRSTSLLPAFV